MVEMEEFLPDDHPLSKLFLPVMDSAREEFREFLRYKRPRRVQGWPREITRLYYRKMRARADRVTQKKMLMYDFLQMMYVSGETSEPSSETTGMVEEIVRQQVIEMVCTPSPSCKNINLVISFNMLTEAASDMY